MSVLRAVRDAVPGLSRVSGSPPAHALIRSWRRRRAVARPVRFAALEFFSPRGRPASYSLPDSAVTVVLRHRTRDVEILDEIFVEPSAYRPPPPVAELLRSRPLRVLDLGGNIGLFSAFVLRHYDVSRLITFEPDPTNLPVLRRCRAVNSGPPWLLVEACAAPRAGVARFVAGGYADSHVAFDGAARTVEVRTVDVFPYLAQADFVKIDIEGSEWELLVDERFSTVAPTVLVMEWHAVNCPTADPYATAVRMLEAAGYTVDGANWGYSHGTLWAWRSASPALPVPARAGPRQSRVR